MTITREQVADLQPGDVVRYRRDEWAEGSFIEGPLSLGEHPADKGLYVLEGYCCVRHPDGRVYEPHATLTVVSRAPRPLYVNHPRTEPTSGDVARPNDGDVPAFYMYGHVGTGRAQLGWFWPNGTVARPGSRGLVLLVDGETGQVVP